MLPSGENARTLVSYAFFSRTGAFRRLLHAYITQQAFKQKAKGIQTEWRTHQYEYEYWYACVLSNENIEELELCGTTSAISCSQRTSQYIGESPHSTHTCATAPTRIHPGKRSSSAPQNIFMKLRRKVLSLWLLRVVLCFEQFVWASRSSTKIAVL